MSDDAPNATFATFGWPGSRVAETDHWGVMLRPAQPTLGSLVVACNSEATAFGEIGAPAFAEFGKVVAATEAMLKSAVGYEKINWLMLMMVDPHVHFHVLPRYPGAKALDGLEVTDSGWPGPPALGAAVTPDERRRDALLARLRAAWPL